MNMNETEKYCQRILEGDTKAFSELYKLTYKHIYFICISFLKNSHDAKDVMQETYLTAFSKLSELKDMAKFNCWLEHIAVNKCRDFIKKRIPVPTEDEELEEILYEENELILPEEYIVNSEKRRLIMDIIRYQLSDLQYQTVILYYFNQFTVKETADLMECSEGAVKNRLSTARSKIKSGVEMYEKKHNYKLYSLSSVPFLTLILMEESGNIPVPDLRGVIIKEAVKMSAAQNVTAAAKIMNSMGRIGAKMINSKIAAGAAAAVIAATGVITAAVHVSKTEDVGNVNYNDTSFNDNSSAELIDNTTVESTSLTYTSTSDLISTEKVTKETETSVAATDLSEPESETISDQKSTTESDSDSSPATDNDTQTVTDASEIAIEDVISAYKSAIESKRNYVGSYGVPMVTVEYTLFDMNHDDTPELIIKYGVDEASMMKAFYTYDENGLKEISDGDGAGHSSFAYDTVTKQFVIAHGHMGSGSLTWIDYENGNIVTSKHVNIVYNDSDEFGEKMRSYGVEYLSAASFDRALESTYEYSYPNGEFQYTEKSGCDYSFLENYQF